MGCVQHSPPETKVNDPEVRGGAHPARRALPPIPDAVADWNDVSLGIHHAQDASRRAGHRQGWDEGICRALANDNEFLRGLQEHAEYLLTTTEGDTIPRAYVETLRDTLGAKRRYNQDNIERRTRA